MVDSKRSSLRSKEDRISELPDPLICQILFYLSTKDAVTTSVLSTRWKTLWLWVPCLDLAYCDVRDFNAFMSLGDRFFGSNRGVSCLHRVKLNIDYDETDISYLKSWIDVAVKRKIQHLDIRCSTQTDYEMPLRLFKCETLVSLRLYEVEVTLDHTEFISLPCLKTLHLKFVRYLNEAEATFERLISCCPVLEELKIFECPWGPITTVYRVFSKSLKKLKIKVDEDLKRDGFGFVIDAPRLSFLSIKDNYSDSYIIKNMDSSAQVDISLPFGLIDFDEARVLSRRSSIRCFLTGISKVRDITICRDTFKLIRQYSKSEPLPQFGYMSRVHITLCIFDLKWLPTFLESCANLKYLTLVWNGNYDDHRPNPRISFSSVPECVLSSLEIVDIKASITVCFPEMKVARYFLENSAKLKKLTLRLDYNCEHEMVFKTLLAIPRRSATCEVVLL